MTLVASIDGSVSPRRVFLHADTIGASVHPIDIYKEVRALRRTDESLRKYNMFMVAFGNVDKGGGKATERYVQLLNCVIVPYDTSHILTVTGTVINDSGQEGILVFDKLPLSPTTSVDIAYVPPQVEVIKVSSGSGLSVEQAVELTEIHTEVQYIERWIHIDTEQVTQGIGTQASPFNTLDVALTYMEANGFLRIHTVSDLTLDRTLKNFVIVGIGNPIIDFNGQNIDGSDFQNCTLKGLMTGVITIDNCDLFDGVQVSGRVRRSAFLGIVEQIGSTNYSGCYSGVTGLGYPKLKITAGNAGVRGFVGSLGADGVTSGDHSIGIGSDGRFISEATCTGGLIHVRGFPFQIIDNSQVGCVVTDETESEKVREMPESVWDFLVPAVAKVGSYGEFVKDKLLTTFKFMTFR